MTNDLISRSKVEEVISTLVHEEGVTDEAAILGCMAWNAVHTMKAVDAAPVVHGRWIAKKVEAVKTLFECSVCGRTITVGNDYFAKPTKHAKARYPYCHCGARMDGGSNV